MKLFDRLRRTTDAPARDHLPSDPLHAETTFDGDGAVAGGAIAPHRSADASPAGGRPPVADQPVPERYDPSHPAHAPVSGVDLVLFARVTHRLRVAPAGERVLLLSRHGHTPETWSAVNTAWMARLGQMPYLCATFDAAARTT